MNEIPLSPPPPGVESNFENPESRAFHIHITTGICIFIILVFASLRLYARNYVQRKRHWSDLIFILSILFSLTFICMVLASATGEAFGRHQWDTALDSITKEVLQVSLISQSIYGPAIWLVKVTLFLLYLEIFSPFLWFRFAVYGGIIVTGLFYFSSMISLFALCSPRNGSSKMDYLVALISPECSRSHPLIVIIGVANLVSDVYMILLPLPAIWGLNMPTKRKIGLSTAFMTGAIACGSSVAGLYYRIELVQDFGDNTWIIIPVWIAVIVEMTAGILVCCMPAVATVYSQLKTSLSGWYSKPYSMSSGRYPLEAMSRSDQSTSTENLKPKPGI